MSSPGVHLFITRNTMCAKPVTCKKWIMATGFSKLNKVMVKDATTVYTSLY
jgi:hypothetical protein